MARNDIRIDISLCDHPKTKRLIRKLGYEAFFSVIKLWSSAARLYQKGVLKNCDELDIADISGWSGNPEEFCKTLVDKKINFLDYTDGVYSIHDWEINQPWVYNSDIRSNMARKSVSKRWENKTNTQRIHNVKDSLYESDTPTPIPIPIPIPLPNPIPNPNHKEREKKPTTRFSPPSPTEVTEYAKTLNFTLDGEQFCAYYEARGWMLGRMKMKSWKAAVVTWKKMDKKRGNSKKKAETQYSDEYYANDEEF